VSVFEGKRDLLDRFRRGDRAALAEVYERYVDDVAMVVRRGFTMESQGLVVAGANDREVEREIIQDTFLRAFAEAARLAYDGLRPYRPYLLRITKNLMIDRLRARSREGAAIGDVGDIDRLLETNAPFEAEPERDAAEDLRWRLLQARTAEYVAGLDDESRELVRLRFDEELSQDVVASRMRCTRRRVRTLEERVQDGLRRHLKKLNLLDG
jgi:RNA polymerase sigma factor (sigma-70 family)